MASGSGRTLGAALVDLFTTGGRPGGARSSYHAKGWQAQFNQLSSTAAGYKAMEAAGVSATTRTQRGWLSGEVTPNTANRAGIAQAYALMRGGFGQGWKTAKFEISGRVTMGRDSRDRGSGGSSPLRVDGAEGRWDRIEEEFNGAADPDTIERLFITDVIEEDLGEGSFPWEFDGNWYTVTA